MTTVPAGVGAAAGWMLDRSLGEPPAHLHPVVWFGTAMRRLERSIYRDNNLAGIAHLAVGTGLAVATGVAMRRLVGRPTATAVATFVSIAGRMLSSEADAVLDAIERGHLDIARSRLPALVGRDVTDLPPAEMIRAVIESLAENTVDAVTAPLWWASVGGPAAVFAHRAVNTLDAMVGHRNDRYRRFGWASARADDVLNWLPARLSAVVVAALVPHRARAIAQIIHRDAGHHPSPNGGVIEAAFAAALNVRLGGVNRYAGRLDDRGELGDGSAPELADGRRAIRLAQALGAATAATLAAIAVLVKRPAPSRSPR